ncbi:MAG: bifunctional 2-polyprenyl-6-hydroxyphenol methylase/3-demethylubiquinol 3-O-methyltransferase UbiG [Alphaproteobacteria bacterium]|nr:bifunctional 2-polyprenyl-6-hydroxyphenol methylase/3-demethylubiquinol 3-O-methyltransferase UbiG [Alphaproteobacteria bacterium]
MQKSTVNPKGYQFDQIAPEWWDESGPFSPLHKINPVRLRFIVGHLRQSLAGLKIIDIGCGGGLVCEPLARLGATVTGIDTSPKAIATAWAHAKDHGLVIDYRCGAIEDVQAEKFDAVLALEIIEHVENPAEFIARCVDLLKKDGVLILSTLNRTWQSYLKAIMGAEYILKWVPKGTHDWNQFFTPAELADLLRPFGVSFIDLKGIDYHPIKRTWSLGSSLSVNYIGAAKFTQY